VTVIGQTTQRGMAHSLPQQQSALPVTLVSVRHANLRSRRIPCHLPRGTTYSRAANSRAARALQRSARVCPPGSSQGAGAAQGLWSPSTTGCGQHHLDRGLGDGF
jgi:hypothetical protein